MTIQSMFYSLKKYGFVQDGAEVPENSVSPDGTKIKKNGEWVSISKNDEPKSTTNETKTFKLEINKKDLQKNREKLKNEILANIQGDIIKGENPKERRLNAMNWVTQNIKSPLKTDIGEVYIDSKCIDKDFHHGASETKLNAVPAIKDVMEKGVYMGNADDMDGKSIKNHYFAGKIKINNEPKIVFCRVRESAGDQKGKRFYLHDVFTDEDIEKGTIQLGGTNTNGQKLTGSPLFKNIINEYLNVNQTGDHAPTLIDLFEMIKRPA